jgi:hypothetical protein
LDAQAVLEKNGDVVLRGEVVLLGQGQPDIECDLVFASIVGQHAGLEIRGGLSPESQREYSNQHQHP